MAGNEEKDTAMDMVNERYKKKENILRYRDKRKKNKENMNIRIGTWNVRTMLLTGRIEEIAKEMKQYKIKILALQEIRWEGEGRMDVDEYTLFYGGENKRGKNGTGFIVDKKIRERFIEFKRINGRISVLRMKNKIANITFINVYAPTEETNEEDKNKFYEEIEKTYEAINKHDTIIILGDFNAQIGKEEYLEEIAGKETIHERTNDNGRRLCNMAMECGLFIMSTKYKHKKEHKITWVAPNQKIMNQIDHVLIDGKRQKMIQDVRSYRGANVDTDHYLVIARMKLRSMDTKVNRNIRRKWNIEKLKDENIQKQYQREITKNLNKNRAIEEADKEWDIIKSCIKTSADKVVGRQKENKRNSWYDRECALITKHKKEARLRWIRTRKHDDYENYKKIRKESTKIMQRKKNSWIESVMEEISQENNNNTRIFQQVRKQNRKKALAIIDSEKWEYHFRELLTEREQGTDNDENSKLEKEDKITTNLKLEIPSQRECYEVIDKLKQNKAAGPDGISAELIKNGGEELRERIYKLITNIWIREKMPIEYRKSFLIPVLKGGDPSKTTNYRGIMLLNIAYKILSTIILNRVKNYTETAIGEYQTGFRSGKSTVDAIYTINQIIEKSFEQNIELHILFIDFKQAFDCLKRETILKEAEKIGIPYKIVNLMKMTMENSMTAILTQDGMSNEFEYDKGVRQGDGLAATMFTIALEGVIRDCEFRGTIADHPVQVIAYADDIAIIAKSKKYLKEAALKLITGAEKRGLKINQKKTKYMNIDRTRADKEKKELKLGEYQFEEVDSFRYLGTLINNKNQRSEEITQRIQAGYKALHKYKKYLSNKKISKRLKNKIYKTAIRPVVTYAGETACITKKDEERLMIFERKIIRRINGPRKINQQSYQTLMNHEINEILNGENIVRFIKALRIRWYGHVQRREETKVLKRITDWKPFGNRKRGRPKIRWEDQVKEDLKRMRINNWREKIKERKEWKKIVERAKSHQEL